jgi:hypothetical protein
MNGGLDSQPLLNNALCLPDSLDVYVGETFTAYLGVINTNQSTSIRRLTVTAHLQTPSQRWLLPSPLDGSSTGGQQGYGIDVPPMAGIDAVVSHDIEEPGQHILRAEVTSLAADGNLKTFRKFYRFQVAYPVELRERTVRAGDASCWVTLSVEHTNNAEYANSKDVIVIPSVEFQPAEGLTAKLVGEPSTQSKSIPTEGEQKDAISRYDKAGVLQRGTVARYLFLVEASSDQAKLRGLAAKDVLGKALVNWQKSMGERGRISSPPILCPKASRSGPVFQSGLSVDMAASQKREIPVTVEPIDPPGLSWQVPAEFQFLVVNHGPSERNLQLHFRSKENGLAVYGQSSLSLGNVPANGGSKVATIYFVALTAGLLRLDGCSVIDLATDTVINQPPLLDIFVTHDT